VRRWVASLFWLGIPELCTEVRWTLRDHVRTASDLDEHENTSLQIGARSERRAQDGERAHRHGVRHVVHQQLGTSDGTP